MFKKSTKQLDKLSQWTGETFFKENKTELSHEFREFEKEIDVRKNGIERLHATSLPYHSSLAKRKPNPDPYPTDGHSSKEKILPGEALGLVMISHGEELQRTRGYSGVMAGDGGVGGEMKRLGEMLEKMGRGRCRVAAVQEDYTLRMGESYIAGMENALEVVKEYQAMRKKLDSRRLALDAAVRKMNSSKKENRALEDDVETAQARYEEAQEDTHSRMLMLQECEARQMAELTDFLEAEVEFVERYREVLVDLKGDWDRSIGSSGSATANRPRSKSTSAVLKTASASAPPSRTGSSSRLSTMLGGRPALPSRQSSRQPSDDDATAGGGERGSKRPGLGNRDRSYSNASTGSAKKEKEKRSSFMSKFGSKKSSTPVQQREMGLVNRGGYSSFTGQDEGDAQTLNSDDERETSGVGRMRDVDADSDDSDEARYGRPETQHNQGTLSSSYGRSSPANAYAATGRARSSSNLSTTTIVQPRFIAGAPPPSSSNSTTGTSTPPTFRRNNTLPTQQTIRETRESVSLDMEDRGRVIKAVYDYAGKAKDELTLTAGDIIEVTQEVSADWWIGENELGQTGLFPSTYTEPYSSNNGASSSSQTASNAPLAPPLPTRQRSVPPVFGAPMPSNGARGATASGTSTPVKGKPAPPPVRLDTDTEDSEAETDSENPFK